MCIDFRLFRSRKKYLFLFNTESLNIKSKGSLNSKQRLNFQLQKVKRYFLKTVFSASCVLREKSVHRRNRFSWNQLYAKCAGKNKSRCVEQSNNWAPSFYLIKYLNLWLANCSLSLLYFCLTLGHGRYSLCLVWGLAFPSTNKSETILQMSYSYFSPGYNRRRKKRERGGVVYPLSAKYM